MPTVIGSGYSVAAPPPPTSAVFPILDPPDGGAWAIVQQPRVVSYNGYSYSGFVGSTGVVSVVATNESTQVNATPAALHTLAEDDHDNPALWVRASDHKLMACYCAHDGSSLYLRISTTSLTTDPTLADGFDAEVNLDSQLGGIGYTYPAFLQLTGETSSPLYLFWRYRSGTQDWMARSKSTDGGVTWSTRQLIVKAVSNNTSKCYWSIATNGTDRYDVFVVDYSDASTTTAQMYHFYYTGGSYYKSDGTLITSDPIADASAMLRSAMTLVLANTSGGVQFPLGASWDGSAPAALAWQYVGSSDRRVVSVRWRSGAWQANTVLPSQGTYHFAANGCGPYDDPDLAVAPRKIGAHWEMFRYTSADDGVTWTEEQLTSGSTSDNLRPAAVWNATADLQAVWVYGTFTNDTSYSLGLTGTTA